MCGQRGFVWLRLGRAQPDTDAAPLERTALLLDEKNGCALVRGLPRGVDEAPRRPS